MTKEQQIEETKRAMSDMETLIIQERNNDIKNQITDYTYKQIKRSAYQAFAEELKNKAYTNNYCEEVVRVIDIDEL